LLKKLPVLNDFVVLHPGVRPQNHYDHKIIENWKLLQQEQTNPPAMACVALLVAMGVRVSSNWCSWRGQSRLWYSDWSVPVVQGGVLNKTDPDTNSVGRSRESHSNRYRWISFQAQA